MLRKLNLGSGVFKKAGYVNIDLRSIHDPDVQHDLNQFPYPFADDEFELVEADHVLEHLDDPFRIVKELHRICKDGAVIIIRVPHFTRGFTHSGHKRGFDVTFPYYFNPSFKAGYQGVELGLKHMKFSWFAQPYLKRSVMSGLSFSLACLVGRILSLLANAAPFLCSRFWCFWVGGFEEIEFHFVVRK